MTDKGRLHGRTMPALSSALTLLVNPAGILFRPLAGISVVPPFCETRLQKATAFCVSPMGLNATRIIAGILLLVVASGWRPRLTGVLHWWIAFSLQNSAATLDGGDQAASVLTLLLIPMTLADGRKWHWQRRDATQELTRTAETLRLIAVGAYLMIRVQVAAIYFHAAVSKLRITEWVDGTAMYYWLRHPVFGTAPLFRPLVEPILTNGATVTLLTWGVIALEFFLAMALIGTKPARKALLLGGELLHIGIILFQGLTSFGMIMCAALLLYLWPTDEEFEFRFVERLRRAWKSRASQPVDDLVAAGE